MPHVIERTKCAVCGACETECPQNAISIDESNQFYSVDVALCNDCGSCVEMCPTEAITPQEDDAPRPTDDLSRPD